MEGYNSIYCFRGAWKYNRRIFFLMIANTFVTAIAPFIGILFPRQILDELTGARRSDRLCWLLAAFFLASSLTAYAAWFLKGVFMAQPARVALPYMNAMYRKCMDISYQCTEDSDFLNNAQTAATGCGRDNFSGISGMLHKWFEAPGAVIAVCGYIAILWKLNLLILLYLLSSIGIHYVLSLVRKRYEHSRREELAGEERRSGYLYDIMYDFSYGKEIRLYGLSDWLGGRFLLYRDKVRIYLK